MAEERHPLLEQALQSFNLVPKTWTWLCNEYNEVRKAPTAIIVIFAIGAFFSYKVTSFFSESEIKSFKESREQSDLAYKILSSVVSAQRAEADEKNAKLASLASVRTVKEASQKSNPDDRFELFVGDISNRLSRLETMQNLTDTFVVSVNGTELQTAPEGRLLIGTIETTNVIKVTVSNRGRFPINNLTVLAAVLPGYEDRVVAPDWEPIGRMQIPISSVPVLAWRAIADAPIIGLSSLQMQEMFVRTNGAALKGAMVLYLRLQSERSELREFATFLKFVP